MEPFVHTLHSQQPIERQKGQGGRRLPAASALPPPEQPHVAKLLGGGTNWAAEEEVAEVECS